MKIIMLFMCKPCSDEEACEGEGRGGASRVPPESFHMFFCDFNGGRYSLKHVDFLIKFRALCKFHILSRRSKGQPLSNGHSHCSNIFDAICSNTIG